MTQPDPMPHADNAQAEKARMLITILGNEFTRKSSHPFFRSLAETAANPDAKSKEQPDISRALKNLMQRLSSQNTSPQPVKRPATFSADTYISPDQHPALIAATIAKMDSAKRRTVLRGLSGPLACRVLVFLREIEDKSA